MSSRLRRALPVLGVFAALAVLYIVEAFLHHSPWIFFDELDYSTTARRIADLGTPPGGKPYHFNGLYPFLIAPAWLADDGDDVARGGAFVGEDEPGFEGRGKSRHGCEERDARRGERDGGRNAPADR